MAKQDIYQAVTDRIIEALDRGTVPWRNPDCSATCPCDLSGANRPSRGWLPPAGSENTGLCSSINVTSINCSKIIAVFVSDSKLAPMHPSGRQRYVQRGAVMVIALFALILLAALLFYIYNVGTHVAKRVETQNAADASVKSEAGWVARKMNLVSMNNVEITRTLAMIQMMDSLPEATEYSLADTKAALDACERQFTRGNPPWLREGLEQVREELKNQHVYLDEIRVLHENPDMDVRRYTHYHVPNDAPFPEGTNRRGRLWQAIEAMDDLSVVSMESLGELAPYNAQRAAEVNQSDDDKGVVFMPAAPSIP